MNHGEDALPDTEALRRLFRRLESTDVDELEVVLKGARLYVRREPGLRAVLSPQRMSGREASREPAIAGVPIMAPLTGVLYTRPSPEQSPFATVGETVQAGQVVALIETMKLFNEVTSDFTGDVVQIMATDGDLVEEGQPLLYLRPRVDGEET